MESARILPEPESRGQKSDPVMQSDAVRRDDVPAFDTIPHFHSARRRLPPDEAVAVVPILRPRPVELIHRDPAPLPRRWPELLLSLVAGFCAGAVFVLILTWGVAP